MPHTINNTPNTNLPFEVLTSYNSDLFTAAGNLHGGGDAGYGALAKRDVATELVMYKPYDNSLDTLIQTTGGFEVAQSSVHEWTEDDELLDDETVGDDTTAAGQINATTANDYSAATTGNFLVTTANSAIFRVGDVVRYVASGAYVYAHVTSVGAPSNGRVALGLTSFSGDLVAAAGDAVIQRMHALRGSDLNYDVEPRGSIPKQYYTYINKMVHDARYGARVQNEDHYVQLLDRHEQKLFGEMRRSRELQALYGVKGKFTLSNGDVVYSSPGLYNEISGFNKDTAEMTTASAFDATKFKQAIYDFIEFNFGAESGGPSTRTMFISGKFASYLSQAFTDIQRFYEVEYIAGVRVMRWEHNLGNIDFVYLPVLDYKHPLPGGSLKEASSKAVGMLCPIQECVTRLVMNGEGPSSEVFKEKGGDEEENMRVKTTEGLKLKLKQYCAVLEET
jgi:hypothetical protein